MKKNISFAPEDIQELLSIAEEEGFEEVAVMLKRSDGNVCLDQRTAQILMNLLVYEGYRLTLSYPYDDPSHPKYNPVHKTAQEEYFHGLYLRCSVKLSGAFEINHFGKKV